MKRAPTDGASFYFAGRPFIVRLWTRLWPALQYVRAMRGTPRPSRLVKWTSRVAPRLARGLAAAIERTVFRDPRLAAKFYAYQPNTASYLIPKVDHAPIGKLAIPPSNLWLGYADSADRYLEVGRRRADRMIAVVRDAAGFALPRTSRILDFGCASGSMLRWFEDVATTGEAWGVDIAATPILWCMNNLSPPFRFATSTTFPHLPFEDGYFDFIYAVSVFTHIADLAETWLLELRRILRRGGILFATIHDSSFIEAVLSGAHSHPKRDRMAKLLRSYDRETHFSTTGFSMFAIDRVPGPGGSGQAQVFYDTDYVRRHWGNYFSVLAVVPDALGGLQAGVVLKRDS